jgi:hypothetical protein
LKVLDNYVPIAILKCINMYNIRKTNTIPTLAKRCCVCGKFLFKKNLGKNEKFHRVKNVFMCHQCYIVLNKEDLNGKESNQGSNPENQELAG